LAMRHLRAWRSRKSNRAGKEIVLVQRPKAGAQLANGAAARRRPEPYPQSKVLDPLGYTNARQLAAAQ
jgi:hypothetical protein